MKKVKYGYVYKTINLQTSKVYIGVSTSLNNRINSYLGGGILFKKVLKDTGRKFFKKTILGYCYSKKKLLKCEEICVEHFDSTNNLYGYNLMAKSGHHGKHNEQTKLTIKSKLTGRKWTEAERLAHKVSDETKLKIKNKLTGRKMPEAERLAHAGKTKGRKFGPQSLEILMQRFGSDYLERKTNKIKITQGTRYN